MTNESQECLRRTAFTGEAQARDTPSCARTHTDCSRAGSVLWSGAKSTSFSSTAASSSTQAKHCRWQLLHDFETPPHFSHHMSRNQETKKSMRAFAFFQLIVCHLSSSWSLGKQMSTQSSVCRNTRRGGGWLDHCRCTSVHVFTV